MTFICDWVKNLFNGDDTPNKNYNREDGANAFRSQISKWQEREGKVLSSYTFNDIVGGKIDMIVASNIHRKVINSTPWVANDVNFGLKDYWATSEQVIARGNGDCEDQAALIVRRLAEAGFPYDKLGITIVSGHAFATIQYVIDDFYVLDNGYMTNVIRNAKEFFPYVNYKGKALVPIVGFNMHTEWHY